MKQVIAFFLFILVIITNGQTTSFNIYLEPLKINGLGGIQSYAFGQYQGKWLIIGGRLDGLHRRQPFASFDIAGNNNQIWVVDPQAKQIWKATLTGLPASVQEQFSSTNMEFHQDGKFLYLIGGYGYHVATSSRKTFDYLSIIDVPKMMQAIMNAASLQGTITQIQHPDFAVTGGHLKKIYQTYYLIGGNQFDGNYNPMGNPTYTQKYTEEVRRFQIDTTGGTFNIIHLKSWNDPLEFHRRDYNAVPQIMPNGQEGVTAFSGVFQPKKDLPFLNCVNMDSAGYNAQDSFLQYYNHYHCAVMPLYSVITGEMHNVFFGGIAQYYDSSGVLVQDPNVPFVKTIARVTRNPQGNMSEYKLPVEMPGFLGAGSEFIKIDDIPAYSNEVIKLDELTKDSNHIGYIYGGINSSAANIFFTNTGSESVSNDQLFKVYIIKNKSTGIDKMNPFSHSTLNVQTYPNPNTGNLYVFFHLERTSAVKIMLHDLQGKLIYENSLEKFPEGNNQLEVDLSQTIPSGIFFLTVRSEYESFTQKIILH